MDDLDPESRDALRRYREHTVLAAPARERVRQRLEASLAAADPDRERAESGPQPPIHAPRRNTLLVLTALAAAVLLALCDLRDRLGGAPTPDDSAAPYTAPAPADAPTRPRPPAPAAAPDLAAELAHLQRARAALDTHDPDAALARLGEHAREFPAGQMAQDRELLRVEALCLRGDAAAARDDAANFLRRYPGSPHTARIQSFCPAPPNPVTDPPAGGESSP